MDTKCRLLTKYQVQLTVDYDAHMGDDTNSKFLSIQPKNQLHLVLKKLLNMEIFVF